jgi:hypothetical protein
VEQVSKDEVNGVWWTVACWFSEEVACLAGGLINEK